MKLNIEENVATGLARGADLVVGVHGETDRLTDVVLCAPAHLEAVPCCSVTRESLRADFAPCREVALGQHDDLRRTLAAHGVRCHALPAASGLPDACFTRDSAVSTPWGLVVLNPALPHRRAEADQVAAAARNWGAEPVRRISGGSIEGGDICIARPGLLIVGISGQRTTQAGAEEVAAPFRAAGWDVLFYGFDDHFLHLDTIFCMLDPRCALGCVEVLDDAFLAALAERGIEVMPVTYKEARRLGCNVVSIDGKAILAAAGTPRVSALLRGEGFTVHEVDVSQFAACGGGVHCLTMPLGRRA